MVRATEQTARSKSAIEAHTMEGHGFDVGRRCAAGIEMLEVVF